MNTFVIKNNNLQLYEDLVSAIEEGKEYLVLVDDANELSGLHHVLEYLPKAVKGSRHISKLILTVRDYARRQVMQSVMEVIQPETIKISTLNDDDIRKLMETCYGITNRLYTDRIVAIAEGNARLAMLAGKLAADSESLAAIQDASPLIFDRYVYWILNHSNQQEADETLREFSNELPLLEEIYLKGISYSNHEDFDGALLYAIISVDSAFLHRYLDCLITAQGDHFRVHDHYDTIRLLKIWDTEQYIDLADSVFDYCYSKREELTYWLYWSPVKMMLHHEASHQEIIVKQDLWMQHTIEKYGHDKDRMCLLFTAIEELSCERRRKAVEKFLSLNTNPDVFERLPLEPSHWGGTGSMIPYMQERIEYLRSLLPLVSGIKYLKHKQRIEQEVDCWKERIRSEEVRELLESWYH